MRNLRNAVLIFVLLVFSVIESRAEPTVAGIGASVSGGWIGTPPAQLLAEKLRMAYRADTHIGANGGASRLLQYIPDDLFSSDIVMGVDLFFWDSYHYDCAIPLKAMDRLFERAARGGARLILGNVPKIDVSLPIRILALVSSHSQNCREAINARLTQKCVGPTCLILDIDGMYEAGTKKGLMLDGKIYKERALMPDGLHISTLMSEIIARQALAQLSAPETQIARPGETRDIQQAARQVNTAE